MPVPTEPVCFNKFPNVICGNGDPIEACAVETQEMDFEVELCMVRAQQPVDPSHCTWGVERRGEFSPLGPLAGCFLALGFGLGLVGTASSRR